MGKRVDALCGGVMPASDRGRVEAMVGQGPPYAGIWRGLVCNRLGARCDVHAKCMDRGVAEVTVGDGPHHGRLRLGGVDAEGWA